MPRKILVIEDEPDVRTCVVDLLGMLPECTIGSASDFQEGLAKAHAETWDAVITDQRLPDGRGADILADVSARNPSTLLVLMSAFQDFDAMMHGLNLGHVDHFFQKPFDPQEMLEWMRVALQDGAKIRTGPSRARPFRRIGAAADPRPRGVRRL